MKMEENRHWVPSWRWSPGTLSLDRRLWRLLIRYVVGLAGGALSGCSNHPMSTWRKRCPYRPLCINHCYSCQWRYGFDFNHMSTCEITSRLQALCQTIKAAEPLSAFENSYGVGRKKTKLRMDQRRRKRTAGSLMFRSNCWQSHGFSLFIFPQQRKMLAPFILAVLFVSVSFAEIYSISSYD